MKEEYCFTSKNFNIDMKISALKNENNINKRTFILPGYRNRSEDYLKRIPKEKHSIELNGLRFIVPELLFNPNINGIEEGGIQDGIAQAIKECHPDFRNLMHENIVITGGNSKFPNFKERLHNELIPVSDIDTDIKLFDLNNSNDVVYGMKTFASNIDNLMDLAVNRDDYEELGLNVIWRNCL
jgi:actin-related protein 6